MLLDILPELGWIALMKGSALILIVAVTSLLYLDAFLPSERRRYQKRTQPTNPLFSGEGIVPSGVSEKSALEHADIIWKVRPPPEVSPLKRVWLRLAANIIRLDSKVKGEDPPVVLCPKGGQAVLEAHYRPDASSNKFEKIARFGFTTERGPCIAPIQETVNDIYGLDKNLIVGVGAIIYMFVEKPYRKKNVGTLALDVISLIHAIQGCDFTVLVADDEGSGKLVKWYEDNGFHLAPKLQECFGSPNEIHGKTMIAPTRRILPDGCFVKWW